MRPSLPTNAASTRSNGMLSSSAIDRGGNHQRCLVSNVTNRLPANSRVVPSGAVNTASMRANDGSSAISSSGRFHQLSASGRG